MMHLVKNYNNLVQKAINRKIFAIKDIKSFIICIHLIYFTNR